MWSLISGALCFAVALAVVLTLHYIIRREKPPPEFLQRAWQTLVDWEKRRQSR